MTGLLGTVGRLGKAGLACAVLALLPGCAQTNSPASESPDTTSSALTYERLRELAANEGASPDQLAIISKSISVDELKSAVTKTKSCMTAAGLHFVGPSFPTEMGVQRISYSYSASTDQLSEAEADALADSCMKTHSRFAEMAYDISPAVEEARDNFVAARMGSLVKCLESEGVDTSRLQQPVTWEAITKEVLDSPEAKGAECIQKMMSEH